MSGKQIIYWDACIFLAYIKQEQRDDPNDILGVNELANIFDQGQVSIATSSITFVEVLETTLTAEQYQTFISFFSRRDAFTVEVSRAIAELAHEIRNYHYVKNKPTIGTADAIHLASAIWFKCSHFYTFDGDGTKTTQGLLKLPQPIAGQYSLPILKPKPSSHPQMSMFPG